MYYSTNMMKCWNSKRAFGTFLCITPYILFYIGFIMHMRSNNDPTISTNAKYDNNILCYSTIVSSRIMLAIDLELWYIFSLRFASGVKLLGPKLIMIRHMVKIVTGRNLSPKSFHSI